MLENEFEIFVAALTDDWQNDQRKYDEETKHSLDEEKQVQWHQHVTSELYQLDDFETTD